MPKEWVDNDHYRVVSDDGTKSWLYEADGGLLGPDTCVEVTDHHSDGTTDAFEPLSPLGGGRGDHK